tara:strand:- start:5269 stop:5556 length:288 start_codon:yes stop_codon:yes gene_type:complete
MTEEIYSKCFTLSNGSRLSIDLMNQIVNENQDFELAWLRLQELGYSKNTEHFLFSGEDPFKPEEVIILQIDRNIYFQVFEIQEIIKFLLVFDILI